MTLLTLNTRLAATIAGTALLGLLAACGGDSGSAPMSTIAAATVPCAQLANMSIPAASIGMPTTGAVITASQTVAASGSGASALGEYCLAFGKIMPVDPNAPNIQFQIALPANWNSKVLMRGGGGWNGVIPAVASNILNGASLSPLARGYAVFGSDSGHQSASSIDASFSSNQEAFKNWIGDALKKTRDVALVVVKATYGSAPAKSYFVGSSTGGREALTVAGRWPADWDGVIALYPSHDATGTILGLLAQTRALAAPGAWLNSPKRGVLYNSALAACDALDGVSDAIISNVQACNATFNPSTALLNGVPVRCPGGADTGNTCLSDAQLTALNKINSPVPFNFALANSVSSHPGYNVFISDNGIPSASPLQPTLASFFGSVPPAFPVTTSMLAAYQYADPMVRYAIARDLSFNTLTLDPSNPGIFAARFSEVSALDDSDRDLSAFAAKGGKLLIMHGTADQLVSVRRTEIYVRDLQATMGTDKVNSFLRFYEIPGFGHSISAQFNASWDQLTALESWTEKGEDPAMNQIVTDTAGVPGRTRPLCLYPTFPRYKGSGDANSAASFTCTAT